jgi:hypothetical protein
MNAAWARPPALTLLWIAILLAPCAWAAMLGLQFALTDERCVADVRTPMQVVAVVAITLAILPALFAWPRWRAIEVTSAAAGRTRFMLGLAVGSSVIFALVTILSAVPVWFLDPCRT